MQLQCDASYLYSFLSVSVSNPNNQAQVICIPRPLGPGNSGAFNFSFFKAALQGQICGKIPAKCPAQGG